MFEVIYRKIRITPLPLLLALVVGTSCSPIGSNVTPKQQTPVDGTTEGQVTQLTLEQALKNGLPTLAEFGRNT